MAYNRTKDIFEIFDEFKQKTNRSDRKEVLLKYKNIVALRDVLRGTFDDSIEFLLPKGQPPYTPNRPESTPSSLLRKNRDFTYFVKGGKGSYMPAYKREALFIRLLESIHPADAEIVLSMVVKKPPVKYLTKKLVEETFPDLIKT